MKNLKAQATILAIVFITVVSVTLVGYLYLKNREIKSSASNPAPLTWEECLKQPKSIVQESYPGVCRLPDGRSAVQPLSEEEKKNLQPPNTEESFCGGIASIECPSGFECRLEGNYPDAGGVCVESSPEAKSPDVCPESEWVNCMPFLAPGKPPERCQPEYLDWAARNCPAFKGPVY